MPKRERTTTEKVALGFLGVLTAVGAFFGIRYFMKAAPEEYVCPICGETFATYEELKTHFETAHKSELIEIVWD